MTLIGEDFDYTFTDGARPVFHIKGDSIKADREGTIYLDRVGVTLWDRQGRIFHLESRKASFNRESNEGQLQGNVVVRGPNELELRTARLNLQQKGDVVMSETPVEINYGGKYVAHAGRLNIDIPGEVYTLQQGARIDSIPGVRAAGPGHRAAVDLRPPEALDARRGGHQNPPRAGPAGGRAHLRQPVGRRVGAQVRPRLLGHRGGDPLDDGAGAWAGRAADDDPLPGGEGPLGGASSRRGTQARRVEYSAPENGRVRMDSTGGGVSRTLTARRLEGTLENGVLNAADAFGGVEIREVSRVDGKPVQRHATGQRGSATFKPDGQLATMSFDNNVVYHDGQVTATGNHGALDMEQGARRVRRQPGGGDQRPRPDRGAENGLQHRPADRERPRRRPRAAAEGGGDGALWHAAC